MMYSADMDITEKFYGCGAPLPAGIDGLTVLDLGCGSGRDCYVSAKLVGPKGRVIGNEHLRG
jgi:arsenite methyltransferase